MLRFIFVSLAYGVSQSLHGYDEPSAYNRHKIQRDQASTGDVVVFNWDGCAGAVLGDGTDVERIFDRPRDRTRYSELVTALTQQTCKDSFPHAKHCSSRYGDSRTA